MSKIKQKTLLLSAITVIFTVMLACSGDNIPFGGSGDPDFKDDTVKSNGTDILMLIVDYTTNKFVGGKELHFDKKSPTFTITSEYQSPGDFGWIKLYYSEIDELIFHGGIIWMGCGEIEFPTDLLNVEDFEGVPTYDIKWPQNGFESIFPVDTVWLDYFPNSTIEKAWMSIQSSVKAREYLSAEKVKVYEWQPSVGCGDIADRKWIFFLKK